MQAHVERSDAGAANWVASITYRSQASRALSVPELQSLVGAARGRNRSIGITGMLLCDGNRYLQTIEGPPDALDRVWESIRHDPRHGSIEILSEHMVPARLFSGLDMQFCCRDGRRARSPAGSSGPALLVDHIPAAAGFALAGDDSRLNALIGDLVNDGWVGDALVRYLLEPTARMLGDAWLADECSEIDLTIGLSMLQLAGHAVQSRGSADKIRKSRYSVLLATAPGEPHLLGPSLLGDMFNNAGWTVDIAFPGSDEALARQLRSQRPDAVDIALSDALPRHHALARLRETVAKCRGAPDELVVVSVGGRLFAEAAATALTVGADHARTSAAGTSVRLAQLIEQRRMGS